MFDLLFLVLEYLYLVNIFAHILGEQYLRNFNIDPRTSETKRKIEDLKRAHLYREKPKPEDAAKNSQLDAIQKQKTRSGFHEFYFWPIRF
jgi:hypothetical protein